MNTSQFIPLLFVSFATGLVPILHDSVNTFERNAGSSNASSPRRACGLASTVRSPSINIAVAMRGKRSSNLELGIRTVQILDDRRKRDEVRRDVTTAFPLVPSEVVDTLLDVVADGFRAVAPDDLRRALRPGYIAKNREKFKRPLVAAVLDADAMRNLPVLGDGAKRSLVEKLADLAIDQLLSEAEGALTAPEVRLAELEERVREVKSEMGLLRLILYRARTRPFRLVAVVSFVVAAFYLRRVEAAVEAASKAYWAVLFALTLAKNKSLYVAGLISKAFAAASTLLGQILPA